MNFIGHAYVALRRSDHPAFVLGAMLPDFLSMARIRGAKSSDPDVVRGVAFHHASDEAFHGCEVFVRLSSRFGEELEARGVRRGPARAVAHVGLELLLDGFLVERPGVADAYLAAIAEAGPRRLGAQLTFTQPQHEARYEDLSERLSEWGVPTGYRDPTIVRDRLVRILRDRPRLALDGPEIAVLGSFLPGAKDLVAENLESMVLTVTQATRTLPIS